MKSRRSAARGLPVVERVPEEIKSFRAEDRDALARRAARRLLVRGERRLDGGDEAELDQARIRHQQRADQARAWMWNEVHETMLSELRGADTVRETLAGLEPAVERGEIGPSEAARRILTAFRTAGTGSDGEP